MLLYIMGDSNKKQADGSDPTQKPLDPIASVNVNFKEVQEGLDEIGMKTLNEVLSNCRNAINTAHSNAKEAFKYQQEVERFLKKNTVLKQDKSVDYDKSNTKVNFQALENNMYYVGNRHNWIDFASEYVGKWTQNQEWEKKSEYIFEGKHINVGDDLKDSGVETFNNGDKFYGKFAQKVRTSGVYTWSNTSNYMGNFGNGNVNGFGGLTQKTNESSKDKPVYDFIFGEFSNNKLPESYILKRGDDFFWVSQSSSTKLSKLQAKIVSYYLHKITMDFDKLGIWTKAMHKLEDKTGLNRTGLYAIAALGLAGVGFWAYKKFKKSITQKNKALTKAEKARITRAKNKAAAASASASDSNSASAIDGNSASGSASAMESNASAPAATRKNKSAIKSATRKAAAVKAAATRAANKAAKAANVKVEGSNVKVEGSNMKVEGSNMTVEGSNAVWSSPAESKEDESNATGSKV